MVAIEQELEGRGGRQGCRAEGRAEAEGVCEESTESSSQQVSRK